jgi:hypothetical protein
MSNMIYTILRNTSFNGNLIETERYYGTFTTHEEATARAEELTDSVIKCPSLRGLYFTFYVRQAKNDVDA